MISNPPVELTFTTFDGLELFYRAWLPQQPAKRAVVFFHRGHEHSGRYQELVERLELDDFAVFAWDARGHGRSPGERGFADHFGVLVKDADCFVRHVAKTHGVAVEEMAVVAHSVGAVTVAAWMHDFAPPIRGAVLATPAFRVKLYVPLAIPALRLKLRWLGQGFIKSYVKSKMLTHDKVEAAKYEVDPLIERAIAENILLGLYDTATRVVSDAGAITTPTLVLVAGSDWVVKSAPQTEFVRQLSAPRKEASLLPGFYHAVFHELHRAQPIEQTRRFIRGLFDDPAPRVSLRHADREGFTHQEHRRLTSPLPLTSPKRWLFLGQRLLLQTLGRLSKGIRLGLSSGFDSGRTLDYVYENRPQGFSPLGRMIDRGYLESIGWRGIRQRKENLQSLLRRAIEETHAAGRPVRLLDVAAGVGRYDLEVLREMAAIPITAVLRDFQIPNLEAGRKLAAEMRLKNVTYEPGDAFDEEGLAAVEPKPTIAVVSGLYELFPDNDAIMRSLRGLNRALEADGLLLYTGQPWHPQLEQIARVLTSHRDGKPWIMRRRTQAEMDELVRLAGFEKLDMEIDRWGIFTVSLARKIKGREEH
jgi:alpha-beta hydrolase superfamily lysophospholipase/SAM-dependent methyltransferase